MWAGYAPQLKEFVFGRDGGRHDIEGILATKVFSEYTDKYLTPCLPDLLLRGFAACASFETYLSLNMGKISRFLVSPSNCHMLTRHGAQQG